MKKQLFLSLALLTIGSALHAGKGAAALGGFAAGALTTSILNNRNDREVVYVKENGKSNNKKLKKRIQEQDKRIKELERKIAKQNNAASAA